MHGLCSRAWRRGRGRGGGVHTPIVSRISASLARSPSLPASRSMFSCRAASLLSDAALIDVPTIDDVTYHSGCRLIRLCSTSGCNQTSGGALHNWFSKLQSLPGLTRCSCNTSTYCEDAHRSTDPHYLTAIDGLLGRGRGAGGGAASSVPLRSRSLLPVCARHAPQLTSEGASH